MLDGVTQSATLPAPSTDPTLDREVIARAMFAGWCEALHFNPNSWMLHGPVFRNHWLHRADAWIAAEEGR